MRLGLGFWLDKDRQSSKAMIALELGYSEGGARVELGVTTQKSTH